MIWNEKQSVLSEQCANDGAGCAPQFLRINAL